GGRAATSAVCVSQSAASTGWWARRSPCLSTGRVPRASWCACKPGGRVLATEFYWRKPPTPEARQLFLSEVCPGLQFDSLEDWVRLYSAAGLANVEVETGPFNMMTPAGVLRGEGLLNRAAVMGRAVRSGS